MATRQVLKEEFLTCIICHEVFRDPVTLHCGHTLCAQCVTAYTKTQKDAIKQGCISCPHCRGLTKAPDPTKSVEEWTGQLKTGFFVKGLVETFALETKDDEDSCSLCKDDGETKPAAVWCADCGHALCSDCQKVHRKLNKGHDVEDISDGSTKTPRRKSKITVCEKHPDYVIDLLCEDCDLAICQRCCTLHHRKCESVILLDDALAKIDTVLADCKKKTESQVSEVKSEISGYQTSMDKLLASAILAETNIDSATEKLILKIREKQTELKSDLTRGKEGTLQRLKADMKIREMRLEEVKQRQNFLKKALESTDAKTRYEAYKMFQNCVTSSTEREPQPENYEEYIFNDNTNAVLKLLDQEKIGHIEGRRHGREVNPRLERKWDSTLNRITGITVMYPNRIRTIVVSSSTPQCIRSFSTKSSETQESTLQCRGEAYDVTKISNTRGAASLYSLKLILFFKVKPQLDEEGAIKTRKSYVCLAYLKSGTMVAGSQFPGLIDIIDMKGKILRSFSDNVPNFPQHISLKENGCIIVTDCITCEVVCMNLVGDVQFTYCPPGGTCALRSVSQSDTGEVFIADYTNNRVIELTKTGEYVKDVLKHTDGISNPGEMYIDGNMMYVSVDGRYIHVFHYRT